MTLTAIRDHLQCEVLWGTEILDAEIEAVAASDAMSAVLAASCRHALLVTGLANIQSVRTAHMADLRAVLYVRGVRPNEKAIELARQRGIALLATKLGMFECCALLHDHHVGGVT
jgi:predicted transcriptional regulator